MVDCRIGTERGVKDPVVVEVPLKPHVLLGRVECGRQRDVDEVPSPALLILNQGS